MEEFSKLVEIVEILRSPNGCPWDREQTLESILENIIEEAYEVVNAISEGNFEKIKEETGDLILQGVFISQIAKEMGKFSIEEVLKELNRKIIYRHPHVFNNENLPNNTDEILKIWENKKKETNNILNEIPKNFPTLLYIYKIIQKAKRKNLLLITEDHLIDEVKKKISNLDVLNNKSLVELAEAILTLLAYRNIRMEIEIREKFLETAKKIIKEEGKTSPQGL